MKANGNKRGVQNLNEQKQESLFGEQETQKISEAVTPFHENEGTGEGNGETGVKFTTAELASMSGGLADPVKECARVQKKKLKFAELQSITSRINGANNEVTDEQILSFFGVNPNDAVTPIDYSLTDENGVGVLPLGDISAVKGLAKHGKTFFISMLVASVLGSTRYGFNSLMDTPKVLIVDTEQHRNNAIQVRKRIANIVGQDTDNLNYLTLREIDPSTRAKVVEIAIRNIRPQFVVIDGIADLITDFNDIRESQYIIAYLSQLASLYECHILNVLHTARTSADGSMKGHLGSLLLQKCSDCFEVKRDNDIFTAKHTESRNKTTHERIFAIDADGLPFDGSTLKAEQAEQAQQAKRNSERAKWREVFGGDLVLTYAELKERICKAWNLTDGSSRSKISRAKQHATICCNRDGQFYVAKTE